MPKISDEKRAARRTEITDAALRCFARNGYQRSSMADIIAESGLSAGAIYSYYPSKQELLLAVAEQVLDARRSELEEARAVHALSPTDILRTLITGILAQAPTGVLIQMWGEATTDGELRTLVQTVFGRLRTTVEESLAAWAETRADPLPLPPAEWARAAAPVLVGVIPGFVLQNSIIDGFDADAYLGALPLVLREG